MFDQWADYRWKSNWKHGFTMPGQFHYLACLTSLCAYVPELSASSRSLRGHSDSARGGAR